MGVMYANESNYGYYTLFYPFMPPIPLNIWKMWKELKYAHSDGRWVTK